MISRNFLNNVNELQKIEQLMELWVESFDAFCLSTHILSEAFSTFHNHSPYPVTETTTPSPYSQVSNEFNKVFSTIQRHLQPLVHETFTNRCLTPVVNILSLVPDLNEQMQQRKIQLLDFDSCRIKIQKEHAAGRDSSHPNVQKRAAKLDESAKRLHELQTNIFHTFHEFEQARSQTLGPEFASFLACCHTFSATIHNSTSRLLPLVPQTVTSLAALDFSSIAAELKFDRIESIPVKVEKKTIVNPIVERSEVAGGKYGGYGMAQGNVNNHVVESEVVKVSKPKPTPESPESRVTSIRFKEPVSADDEDDHLDSLPSGDKSPRTNSVNLKDRVLPAPPERPPRSRASVDRPVSSPAERLNHHDIRASFPSSPPPSSVPVPSNGRSSSPAPPPKPPRTRKPDGDNTCLNEDSNYQVNSLQESQSPT